MSGKKQFFTSDEDKASYIEYKISCDDTKDCGFVMVNVDMSDVLVPISSTVGVWPSEALTSKENKNNTKLYYFWAFDQFWLDKNTKQVKAINPKYEESINQDLKKYKESNKNLKEEQLDLQYKKQKENYLKEQFSERQKQVKQYFEKNAVKNKLEVLQSQIESNWILRKSWKNWYVRPWAADVMVPWAWFTWNWCNWLTPCYRQFDVYYQSENKTWRVWCTPVAWWILYWYYDRNWYWSLIDWIAPSYNYPITGHDNVAINRAIVSLNNLMWTFLKKWEWLTLKIKRYLWINYAKNHWYPRSTVYVTRFSQSSSSISDNVKSEINSWRPVILSNASHSMVAFWYSSANKYIVTMNMWWWTTKVNWYTTSMINYDLRAPLVYLWKKQGKVKYYINIKISP